MIDQLKPLLGKLALFSQERLGFKHPPRLFLRNDSQNSQQALGKTAFYNPQEQSVTLFIHGRHPKDILRSFTHELVHHCQNERGDLAPEKMTASGDNYAQECPHMRKMEQEAYLEGSMCFRDWEDTIEDKDLILIKLAESKFLKENKTMTTKITKEFLKETIRKVLNEQDFAGVAPDTEELLKALRQGVAVNKAKAQKAKASAKSGRGRYKPGKARKQKILIDRHFGPELKLMDVQDALLKLGYYGSVQPEDLETTVDDNWGPGTEKALMKFQSDIKQMKTQDPIEADGLAGEDTLEALAHVIQVGPNALKSGRPVDSESLLDTYEKIPDGFKHKFQKFVTPDSPDMSGDVESVPTRNEGLQEGCGGGHKKNDGTCSKCGKRDCGTMEEGKSEEKCSTCGGKKPDGKCPHCDDKKKDAKCICGKITENEELEQEAVDPKKADRNKDGELSSWEKKVANAAFGEGKIQTPEQENTLYEQRFAPKNNRLFEKLVKEWTK